LHKTVNFSTDALISSTMLLTKASIWLQVTIKNCEGT